MTKDSVTIYGSYKTPKKYMPMVLKTARRTMPGHDVWKRTDASLMREWAVHNLLYNLHLFRSHTADVDLDYPQPFIVRAAYGVLGRLALLLIP